MLPLVCSTGCNGTLPGDGLITLPTELQPPKSLKINWWLAVERCEKRYRYYCRVISDLSTFYATHGITAVQLKGVGFANNYPIPSHREGGDIDIFTYSADSSGLSDREANSLADKLMRGRGNRGGFFAFAKAQYVLL